MERKSEFYNQETGLEKSKENYQRAAETLATIAEQISNLSIPEKTIRDWKILLGAMRTVDDKIDHFTDEAQRKLMTEKIVSFLKGEDVKFSNDSELEKSMEDVRNLSAEMSKEQKKSFQTSLFIVMKVTEKIKKETDPSQAVKLTMLEGQVTARLFLPFLPEDFRSSDKYRRLVTAFTRLGRTANSFDSFVDLPTDYENEQIKIKPTILNRLMFFGAALTSSPATIREVGLSRDLITQLFSRTKETTQNFSEK